MSGKLEQSSYYKVLTRNRLLNHTPIEEVSDDEVLAFFFLHMPELVDQELTDEALKQIRRAVIHYRDKYPKLIIDAKYEALIWVFSRMIDCSADNYLDNRLKQKFAKVSGNIVHSLDNMFRGIAAGTSPKNFTYREYFNMLPNSDQHSDYNVSGENITIISDLKQAVAACVANLPNEDAIDFLVQVAMKIYGGMHVLDRNIEMDVASKFSTIKQYIDNLA